MTKCSLRTVPALALNVEEWTPLLELQETTWSSVEPRVPLRGQAFQCLLHHLLDVVISGSFLQAVVQIHG